MQTVTAIGRRHFLITAASATLAGCSSQSVDSPSCAVPGNGPGLSYCLVEKKKITIPGGARLAIGEAVLMAIDDNSAAIVARDDRGIYALSATCSHACCTVALCSDAACSAPIVSPTDCAQPKKSALPLAGVAFLCPCHGSEFGADGAVISGPAQSPLPSVVVVLAGDDAVVDLSRAAHPLDRVALA